MFDPVAPLVAILAYAALLIGVAWYADRTPRSRPRSRGRAVQYGLSLATICSSWTYFGAIGEARNGSWLYFSSGIAPIIALTLGAPLWKRIALLSKQENVGSIADFLAARYGKSRALGSLVAAVCALGALPYLALQLTMLGRVADYVTGSTQAGPVQALAFMAVLCAFAIVFGTRRPSLTQHSRGMVSMVALEACVKLVALLAVAGLCLWIGFRQPDGGRAFVQSVPPLTSNYVFPFLGALTLSTLTAFTLPRQFHLGFVTLEKASDVKTAQWVVPVYFILWPAAVLFIGTAIRAGFGVPDVSNSLQILAIPLAQGIPALALLALLGGVSAGAAMVIAETTAVSAMVSNELILPWLTSRNWLGLAGRTPGEMIVWVRRATVVGIGLLGWAYFVGVRQGIELTHLGFTALAAFAQLFPALAGGIYWSRGNAKGAIAGIAAGTLLWATVIVVPTFLTVFDPETPGGAPPPIWMRSESWLFQLATYASLTLNIGIYVVISLRSTPRLIDTIQANTFVAPALSRQGPAPRSLHATVGDLRALLTQFVGERDAERTLRDPQATGRTTPLEDKRLVDPVMARAAERSLAGAVGASSARNLLAITLAADSQDATEIHRIMDEAAHAVQFGRELLQTILEALNQAVSVIDRDLCLLAWNANYLGLLGLPVDKIYVGKPLAELLDDLAPAPEAKAVRRFISERLDIVFNRAPFQAELLLENGRALRVSGIPLGASDYLTSFVDITDLKRAERVLANTNEALEERVQQRTAELIATNDALATAKQLAERVTGAQQRFVAAASHDLVQPLHAARLFIGTALADTRADPNVGPLLERADQSVESAHRLLRALLNLSQLEVGVLRPTLIPVDAGLLLMSLFEEFDLQARTKGVELIILPTSAWVLSDRDLLRSILQNLVVNAIRYTPQGRVVVACRKSGEAIRFEVRDNGIGMPSASIPEAFSEFHRLIDEPDLTEGAGLGLSIVDRISKILGHPITVRTRLGMGSVFAVTAQSTRRGPSVAAATIEPASLGGVRILCVDDEQDILIGMQALMGRWGAEVTAVSSAAEARELRGKWDAVVADLRLSGEDGLDLLREFGDAPIRILVSATSGEGLSDRLVGERITVLAKPLDPLLLMAALAAGRGCHKGPGTPDNIA